MKTTYILGAGASKGSDFELPCMSDFFQKGYSASEYPQLDRFIKNYFKKSPLSDLNLEDVITAIDMRNDPFGKFGQGEESYINLARKQLSNFIVDRLNYSSSEGKKWCTKHKDFIQCLTPEDSIITLNYDLIIEWSLINLKESGKEDFNLLKRQAYALGRPTYYGRTPPYLVEKNPENGHYIKLHGSLNWLYCPRENCVNNQSFYSTYNENKNTIDELAINKICQACGDTLERVIVPPTMNKVFKKFPKMGFLWNLAHREIILSNRIVIIGLSLTESDYYLRWFLRSAFQGTEKRKTIDVHVVNPKDDHISRLEDLLGNCISADNQYKTLEDFNKWNKWFHESTSNV